MNTIRLSMLLSLAFAAMTSVLAGSPIVIQQGQSLFERSWQPRDARLGGDGLGPLFNGISCVQCHRQGGVGGGGEAEFNANTIGIEKLRIDGGGADDDTIKQLVSAFHPGFVQSDGSIINTLTVPHGGGTAALRQMNEQVLQQVPSLRAAHGGSADASEVRLAFSTPILFNLKQGKHSIHIQARLYQRNTPSLFGSGLVDQVTDEQILSQFRIQKRHPEISGRPATRSDGRIGKFGWRGNVVSLVEFVDQACANEVGLETERRPQAIDPTNRGYRNPTIDITDEQIEAMAAFVAALPRPIALPARTPESQSEIAAGRTLFASIGCAVCHVPDMGVATGLYSDLLLHEMGSDSIDLNHADPYIIRRTPMVVRDYLHYTTTESSAGSMGAYYGHTTQIHASTRSLQDLSARRSPRRDAKPRGLTFVSPDYPERTLNFRDVAKSVSKETRRDTLVAGQRQIEEAIDVTNFYIRLHYEPTKFNEEWRTPPLWGVRDSAPYMHDGRAATLLESIAMHGGEATGTKDRFLDLSLPQRRSVIAFLNSLAAPPNAPQVSP